MVVSLQGIDFVNDKFLEQFEDFIESEEVESPSDTLKNKNCV